jgi:hypothetical protein
MEPITIITLLVLAFGAGVYLDEGADPVVSPVEHTHIEIVDNTPSATAPKIFARHTYTLSPDGYYLSNLTPEPNQHEGCNTPVLIADLSQPNTQELLPVTPVNVGCEE